MEWIRVRPEELTSKLFKNACGILLVSDGKNLGYMTYSEIIKMEEDFVLGFDNRDSYIQGIPDSTSHKMKVCDVVLYIPIPYLPLIQPREYITRQEALDLMP